MLRKSAPVLRAYLQLSFPSSLSALLTFMPMFPCVWSLGRQGTCSECRVPDLGQLPWWLWPTVEFVTRCSRPGSEPSLTLKTAASVFGRSLCLRPHGLKLENTHWRINVRAHCFHCGGMEEGEVMGACALHTLPWPPKAFPWVSINAARRPEPMCLPSPHRPQRSGRKAK